MKIIVTRIKPWFKKWFKNVFATRTDVAVAAVMLAFVLAAAIKITLFNYVLIPQPERWTFRFNKFLTTLLVVAIFYPVLFKFRTRVPLVVFYTAQVLYIMINISYYLYFQNYLHLDVFLANFYEGFIAVLTESTPKSPLLLVAFIDLPFFAFLVIKYQGANRLRSLLRVPINAIAAVALLITIYTQYGHYKEDKFITNIAKSTRLGESYLVQRYGTLANIAVNLYKYRDAQDYIDSLQYGRKIAKSVEIVESGETGSKPDIFIIQVESMDSAIVRQTHGGIKIMPFLDSLADKSIYYPYMFTYHLGGGTSDCEFSVINSVEPFVGYPAIKLPGYNGPNSFVRRLVESSYSAMAFHGNIGTYYNRDMAFRNYGFDEFFDIDKMQLKNVGWGAPDEEVFKFALDRAKECDRPVLSYVITMSSHVPFTNVSNYYNNGIYSDIRDAKLRNYFNSMSYVDREIEKYVREIREYFENAYIFIFGDHCPKVGNEAYMEAFIKIEEKGYEFVPLYIITPDSRAYREEKIVASLLDLAPTILNASGVKYEIRSDGIDLLNRSGIETAKIPYRGIKWDRAALFRHISGAMK